MQGDKEKQALAAAHQTLTEASGYRCGAMKVRYEFVFDGAADGEAIA